MFSYQTEIYLAFTISYQSVVLIRKGKQVFVAQRIKVL